MLRVLWCLPEAQGFCVVPCLGDVDCRRGSHESGGFGLRRMLTVPLAPRNLVRSWDRTG